MEEQIQETTVSSNVKTSKSAIWSLICGIAGIILCLPAIPAIILGIIGLVNIKKNAGTLKGTGLAIAGLVLGGLMIFVMTSVLIFSAIISKHAPHLKGPTPEYIKEVVAYKEGSDGLIVYFILADSSGAMISSNGNVTIKIFHPDEMHDEPLYSKSFNVIESNFHTTTVGIGALKREALLYSFGRITYSSFAISLMNYEGRGKVKIEFQRSDGKWLEGEATFFF